MHLSVSRSSFCFLPLGSIASFFSIFVPLEVRFLALRKLKFHFVPLEVRFFGLGKAQMSFCPPRSPFFGLGKTEIWEQNGEHGAPQPKLPIWFDAIVLFANIGSVRYGRGSNVDASPL